MVIRTMLAVGDRRSNKQADQVLQLVLLDTRRLSALMARLWDADACIRMRAADALEKLLRERAECLQPFNKVLLDLVNKVLLDLAAESTQQEVRWHLAQLIPRLHLNRADFRC